jgi:hypothetical protein
LSKEEINKRKIVGDYEKKAPALAEGEVRRTSRGTGKV